MTFTRTHYAMAASVAALAIAAPAVFYSMHGGFGAPFGYGNPNLAGGLAPIRDKEFDVAELVRKSEAPAKVKPAEPAPGKTDQISEAGEKKQEAVANEAQRITPSLSVDTKDMAMRGDDPARAPADGLGAVGGNSSWTLGVGSGTSATLGTAPSPAPASSPPPPPVAQLAAKPAAPSLSSPDLGAVAGRRMMDARGRIADADGKFRAEGVAPGYNPYAHMDEAEKQKSIALQEFRDKFEAKEQSPIKEVAAEPVSTFSSDVDTASYAFVRRALNSGRLPPKESVRVEEMINYFPYSYPKPETAEVPFQPTVTVMASPWNSSNQLVHIGIKGYDLSSQERPRANLVFLIDVSGSMSPEDKLPLVKNAFRMLVEDLRPDDTIGIVTYAAGSGVLLEPTRVADKNRILTAIDRLGAGGSTAGAQGIQDAYRLAESNFDTAAVNRIILATDGDFNVGLTNQEELKGLIERKRGAGIFLSILGVGQGNYNDSLMQTLAQNGNGTAAYVDTLSEARKVLVDEASSTLFTIAKDVKVQVEWNPQRVSEYRLIGYETRALRREDFNNDRVDAGDIGSGHTVTAIYEVTPVGAAPMVDDLRYGQKTASADRAAAPAPGDDSRSGELGFLKLRYKLPKDDASKLVTLPIAQMAGESRAAIASGEARFSVAVAAFGQLLKGSPYLRSFGYDDVISLATPARGADPFGYRSEFLNLVRLAKSARQ